MIALEEYVAVVPRPTGSLASGGRQPPASEAVTTAPIDEEVDTPRSPRNDPTMTLTTGRAKLVEALKVLNVRWEAARDGWDDLAGREFEEAHVEPITPQVHAAVRAIDRLAVIISQMRHECE